MKTVDSNPAGDERITTIIADDSPTFLFAFCQFLRTRPDTCVVGTGRNGFEAINLVQQAHPRLVVMDFHMPGLRGDKAAAWIAEHFPATHVLVVSSDQHPEVEPSVCQGSCAFMCKGDLLSDLSPLLERWFPHSTGPSAECPREKSANAGGAEKPFLTLPNSLSAPGHRGSWKRNHE